jgi:hypothetical protein
MAYDEGLAERIRDVMGEVAVWDEKKMFGGLGFLIAGNMVCGVSGDGLMARVGLDAYEEALATSGVAIFGSAERPMRGWVLVQPPGLESDEDLAAWVERGITFAATLPPK